MVWSGHSGDALVVSVCCHKADQTVERRTDIHLR
jgi:hypothetical protein